MTSAMFDARGVPLYTFPNTQVLYTAISYLTEGGKAPITTIIYPHPLLGTDDSPPARTCALRAVFSIKFFKIVNN